MEFQPLKVLILGGGKGGSALLDLFIHIPNVELVGLVDKDPSAPAIRRATDLNIPVCDQALDLLAKTSPHLIIDVTGNPAMAQLVQAHKPSGAEVLGGMAARLLWNIVQHEAQLQGQLYQTEKLANIGTFASGIAHDINNPLYVILGLAENLLVEENPATIRDQAREILDSVKRIKALSLDLSLYARRSAPYDLRNVELTTKLDEALKIARYATMLQDISVVKAYTAKPVIKAQPEDILHVFVNLITNAIHAMDGRGTLTLGAERADGKTRVTITDTGCGIPPDHLEKIFEPFFTTKDPGKGTGLGLHNVRTIVEKYYGHIAVTSEVGKGTTFTLEFQAT